MFENAVAELAKTPIAALGALASAAMLPLSIFLAYLQLKQHGSAAQGTSSPLQGHNLAFKDVVSVLLILTLVPGVSSGFALTASASFQLGMIAGTISTLFLFAVCNIAVSLCAGAILSDWLIHRALGDGELARWIAAEDKRKARSGKPTKQSNRFALVFVGWGMFITAMIITVFWIFMAESTYRLLVGDEPPASPSPPEFDLAMSMLRDRTVEANNNLMGSMILGSYIFGGVLGGLLSGTFFYLPIESKVRASGMPTASTASTASP